MAAPEGNQFWQARSSHGRNPKFETADDLWDACIEYFEWVDNNPLETADKVTFQGVGTLMMIPKMRAMTQNGLFLFLGISPQTWANYRERDGFLEITARVESVIYEQKFTGAAADMLNPNIIARELGLADKKELSGEVEIKKIERKIVDPASG